MIKRKAILPKDYTTYVFDLYGTLVDIHTDEEKDELWEKLSLFYGYYKASFTPYELKSRYQKIVSEEEHKLKDTLDCEVKYSHESSPEIEISKVFSRLFYEKGVTVSEEFSEYTAQFFRILSTEYIKLYPGTKEMLQALKNDNKKIYLLSNAQKIFTAFELNTLDINPYFDGMLFSSDYQVKKPDPKFFSLLETKFHVNPKDALFIGNDSKSDILGAKNMGYDTFYVNSNISPKGDEAIFSTFVKKNFTKWDYE